VELTRMGGCAPGLPHLPSMAPRAYCDQAGSAREEFCRTSRIRRGGGIRSLPHLSACLRQESGILFEGSLYGLRKPLGTLRPIRSAWRLVSAYVSKIAERDGVLLS